METRKNIHANTSARPTMPVTLNQKQKKKNWMSEHLIIFFFVCLLNFLIKYIYDSIINLVYIWTLTASVWIGWIANRIPAKIAKFLRNPAIVVHTLVNKTQATACKNTFVAWNQIEWSPKRTWFNLKWQKRTREKIVIYTMYF